MAMDELAERIKASLENANGEPWFPELTADLAVRGWERLRHDIGLTQDSYSTDRVLSRSVSTPREIITSLQTHPSTSSTPSTIAIEALSPDSAIKYQEQGVSFYSAEVILHSTILSCLEDALVIINRVPSLMKTVASLVSSLHLIKPEDADYDVSFSEPRVPFSIFVSVPQERLANDALRVAEAIVHEAMHLQLTLIEGSQLLVSGKNNQYFSPWRREHRNAQGLLHGLYVFWVIAEFLEGVVVSDHSRNDYVSSRRSDIAAERNQILSFSDSSELTYLGSRFVRRMSCPSS
jgi:HEXXH motif-containing protein